MFKQYTTEQVNYSLADCHETLRVGAYEYDHPYARKLWTEIDAVRARAAVLLKAAK